MEEILERKVASPLIAPIIFIFVSLYQLFDKFLIVAKQKVSVNEKDAELRAEIKQLLKEAAALSEPSTFAQSAKLRRMAAAKERELSKSQDTARKDVRPLLNLFEKMLPISKVLTYILLILCFWRTPVAAISKELVQPFGIAFLIFTQPTFLCMEVLIVENWRFYQQPSNGWYYTLGDIIQQG